MFKSALLVGWYRRAPWSDVELAQKLSHHLEEPRAAIETNVRELLANLGAPGRLFLEERDGQAS